MLTLEKFAQADLSALRKVPVPVRENCPRWKPVQHHDLATTILELIDFRGLGVQNVQFSLSKDEQTMAGSLDLALGKKQSKEFELPQYEDMGYSLGFIHDNMGRHSLKFFVGGHVFVCTNGMIVGSFVGRRKHTNQMNLEDTVSGAIDKYLVEAKAIVSFRERLEHKELSQAQADNALMNAGRERLLSWSHIGRVADEYAAPTFEAFEPRNGWSLYNAFTHIAKQSAPFKQLTAMRDFAGAIFN